MILYSIVGLTLSGRSWNRYSKLPQMQLYSIVLMLYTQPDSPWKIRIMPPKLLESLLLCSSLWLSWCVALECKPNCPRLEVNSKFFQAGNNTQLSMPRACALRPLLLPMVALPCLYWAVSSEDWNACCILETYYFKCTQKGRGGTELSIYIDQQKGYFIAGIHSMLSKGENTLNKLKSDFIGFSLPRRGNYFCWGDDGAWRQCYYFSGCFV